MKEKTKFKMIFGKEVTQKDFMDLQKESKLLKPASLNKLLGKRDWKLESIPVLQNSNHLPLSQKPQKKRKLTRSRSFCEGLSQVRASNPEKTLKNSTQLVSSTKKKLKNNQTHHSQFNKQLNIGRCDMDEIPSSENFENYLAYNLRK